MRYIGIDYGTKRWGLSSADVEIGIASPLPAACQVTAEQRWKYLQEVLAAEPTKACVVGYPQRLDGSPGSLAAEVKRFGQELQRRFSVPVHFSDETLTSYCASQQLYGTKTKRSSKPGRTAIEHHKRQRRSGQTDSLAAVILLQDYLNSLQSPTVPDSNPTRLTELP